METTTIDLKRSPSYKAKTQPTIIDIPKMRFVMVEGAGAPDSDASVQTEFQRAMGIIYGIVYTIKFWDKKFTPPKGYAKFTMPPIEGLWWTDDDTFNASEPSLWRWILMHRLPEFVTSSYFNEVVSALCEQKKSDMYRSGYLKDFTEGTVVQMMHYGSYDREEGDIEAMHSFARNRGYTLHGRHHELYFNDPRKVAPEKIKTLLRQPIKRTPSKQPTDKVATRDLPV